MYIYILNYVDLVITYQGTLYGNNVRKCLLESDLLASCNGLPPEMCLKVRGQHTKIVVKFLENNYLAKYV